MMRNKHPTLVIRCKVVILFKVSHRGHAAAAPGHNPQFSCRSAANRPRAKRWSYGEPKPAEPDGSIFRRASSGVRATPLGSTPLRPTQAPKTWLKRRLSVALEAQVTSTPAGPARRPSIGRSPKKGSASATAPSERKAVAGDARRNCRRRSRRGHAPAPP